MMMIRRRRTTKDAEARTVEKWTDGGGNEWTVAAATGVGWLAGNGCLLAKCVVGVGKENTPHTDDGMWPKRRRGQRPEAVEQKEAEVEEEEEDNDDVATITYIIGAVASVW